MIVNFPESALAKKIIEFGQYLATIWTKVWRQVFHEPHVVGFSLQTTRTIYTCTLFKKMEIDD